MEIRWILTKSLGRYIQLLSFILYQQMDLIKIHFITKFNFITKFMMLVLDPVLNFSLRILDSNIILGSGVARALPVGQTAHLPRRPNLRKN